MANFSGADVQSLREQLGTGMVETKRALEEAGGDVDSAVEILRRAGFTTGNVDKGDMITLYPGHSSQQQQEQAARKIGEEVTSQLLRQAASGANLMALGPLKELARDIVARLPLAQNPWSDIVGPCYTSGALQRELGITRAAVSRAVGENRLLRVTTSDGVNLYPAFQVHAGAVVPGLGRVLRALSGGTNSTWTWAQWLNATIMDENGDPLPRNIERLISGHVDDVVRDAQHDAAVWAA
ncbi:hypothetical protein [Microbacterium sp. USHLN186]|uniref:hypothetical protein n=1 Tax=Microbacterium sp. USHLN186 TaxID=3081286 RepID=UPI003018BA7D